MARVIKSLVKPDQQGYTHREHRSKKGRTYKTRWHKQVRNRNKKAHEKLKTLDLHQEAREALFSSGLGNVSERDDRHDWHDAE